MTTCVLIEGKLLELFEGEDGAAFARIVLDGVGEIDVPVSAISGVDENPLKSD